MALITIGSFLNFKRAIFEKSISHLLNVNGYIVSILQKLIDKIGMIEADIDSFIHESPNLVANKKVFVTKALDFSF